MAGSTSTLRVAGYPSGYPAEIDANVKIRWVDNLLINMSEMSTDTLKYLGGTSQFTFTNPKVEWTEDDKWGRRPTHGGLAAAATTSLTVTGAAHRYPVGTLFLHVTSGEIARVTAVVDADTLTLQRDVPGAVTEGAWVSTDEVLVSGFAMSEDDNWTFRANAILSLPFNYAQVMSAGIQVSYRRQSTALYGLRGTDLDYISAQHVAQMFVAMEEQLIHGYRYVGASAARPAMTGGVAFYVTAANGSDVTDLNSAALTRTNIMETLQDLWASVGPENMARTLLVSPWAKQKITSFFSAGERLPPGYTGVAGTSISSMVTDFGTIDIILSQAVARNEIHFIRRDLVSMGNFAGLGRPHLIALASPSSTGPRIQRAFYADIANMVKGPESMGKIQEISTTT